MISNFSKRSLSSATPTVYGVVFPYVFPCVMRERKITKEHLQWFLDWSCLYSIPPLLREKNYPLKCIGPAAWRVADFGERTWESPSRRVAPERWRAFIKCGVVFIRTLIYWASSTGSCRGSCEKPPRKIPPLARVQNFQTEEEPNQIKCVLKCVVTSTRRSCFCFRGEKPDWG